MTRVVPAQPGPPDLFIRAAVEKPHEIDTRLGTAHTLAPKPTLRLLNLAYHVSPDSAAATGEVSGSGTRESEQIMLARLFTGVRW